MMKEELRSAAFTTLNPWQRVPVLVFDDGSVLAESVAICRYFEELHPTPALMGVGALGRAHVEMWQRRVEFGLLNHVTQAFRHLNPKMGHLENPQIAEWGEVNKPKVADDLQRLDERLAQSRYIGGDDYSIADITALVTIDFMKPVKLAFPSHLANVVRWYEEVSRRPSAAA